MKRRITQAMYSQQDHFSKEENMRRISLLLSLFSITALVCTEAYGQSVSMGGKLYDKWWKTAGVDEPSGDQPLWAGQSSNTRSGSTTWRCKECHGWDYKGAAGAYGSGSHFTGFAGVLGSGLSADDLLAVLDGTANADHDFSAMGADQLPSLVAFLSEALIDVGPFIAADKSAIGGDNAHGGELYAATCSACHGADGTTINFHDADEPTYVANVANDNPWEFLHKVRAGQPATGMPSSIDLGWSVADAVDVLSFAQTLTVGGAEPTAVTPVAWGVVKKEMAE